MKRIVTIVCLSSLILMGCGKKNKMEVKLLDRIELEGIPSASGIEYLRGQYYVIGDNSPDLYVLDTSFKLKNAYPIGPKEILENGVVPKAIKKDLEAMCGFFEGSDSIILILGSGSKSPMRDHAKVVRFTNEDPEILEHDLFSFYMHVKQTAKLEDDAFNIEAAAVLKERLYLFNRGENKIIECSLNKFMQHLRGEIDADAIKLTIYKIDLPEIQEIEAGFSGAATDAANKRILFTASVENTANWIDDGQVLGSFVGVIEPENMASHYTPRTAELKVKNAVLPVKVESIAIRQSDQRTARCMLVTDSDGGISELLEVQISFE